MKHNITERTERLLNRNKVKQTITKQPSAKQTITLPSIYWKIMVSASSIRNYMLGDTLVDYLKEMKLVTPEFDEFTKHIMMAGTDFESELLALLDSKGVQFTKIANNHYDSRSGDKYFETIEAMKRGDNIIYQGVLINTSNNTYGMPDLIIRSDYINKLFGYNVISDEEASHGSPTLGTPWHYKIIDIKHSTIHLDCTGVYINNNDNIPAYKGQVYIYTEALNRIQGINIMKGFIWGRKYEYTANGMKNVITNFLTKLGTIDYNDRDSFYVNRTNQAIEWMRDIRLNSHKWKLDTDNLANMRKELFPNMNVISDSCYMKFKKELAYKIGDITLLWNCGIDERTIAHSRGIYSIYDSRLSAEMMGLKDNSNTTKVVNMMLAINKIGKAATNFSPNTFSAEENNWLEKDSNTMEFSFDFETCAHTYDSTIKGGNINEYNPSYIFMIGVYYVIDGIEYYKSFVMKEKTNESEKEMYDMFYDYIKSMMFLYKKNNAIFYHWSPAEIKCYNEFKNKHKSHDFCDENFKFYDLSRVFTKQPIVIKGAYNYKLKTVVRALHGMGYIKTSWDDMNQCGDGLTAMFLASQYYDMQESERDDKIMNDIIEYNKVDCSSVSELLEFLRNHSNTIML
jgi:hypothetical protein